MVRRQALLIGASGGIDTTYLPGVSVDLKAMKSFLMSPQGGAWKRSEITILEDPTLNELNSVYRYIKADYTITMFSGHGFSGESGRRFLCLSDGTYFNDLDLLNSSPRQLLLLDSCRNVITGISGPYLEEEEWSHFDGGESEKERARRVYDRWIEQSGHGTLVIHSTTHGNYSYDTSVGGAFTQKLLHVGNRVKKKEKFNLLSIYSCVRHVPKLLEKEGYDQCPTITYKDGNINLPFALAIPVLVPKPDYSFTKVLLGLGVAGIVLNALDDE